MVNDELVRDIDDLTFESDNANKDIDDLDDISEEELQEIEELVEQPKVKKKKVKPKKVAKPKKQTKPKKKKAKVITYKKPKKKKKKANKLVFPIITVLIVVAVILAVGFTTNWFKSSQSELDGSVAAYVNGVAILEDYLNAKYDEITVTSFLPITKEDVLNTLIEQELMIQEAEKLGIEVSIEEAEEGLNQLLIERNMPREEIEENLAIAGLAIEDLLEDFKYYILVERVANATFKKDITVTDDELANYLADKVFVRHILLLSEDENEEIYASLDELKTELEEDDSKFCDYVTELSQDPGSIANCGKYFFGRGEMVPEFENASFGLFPNEFSVVKTAYGYHLIQKLNIDEETEKVAENTIISEKSTLAFTNFIADLKENAEIEILYSEEVIEETSDEVGFEIVEEEVATEPEIVIDEEVVIEEIVEEVNEEEIVEEIEEEEIIVEEVIEEPEEEVVIEEIIYVKPLITYFYSESDEMGQEITQLLNDLQNQDYIDIDWKCIRVNVEDQELCIELYGEDNYYDSMAEAQELGLTHAPTILLNDNEYVGEYSVEEVRQEICILAGC